MRPFYKSFNAKGHALYLNVVQGLKINQIHIGIPPRNARIFLVL
jgi:hypothetical protein